MIERLGPESEQPSHAFSMVNRLMAGLVRAVELGAEQEARAEHLSDSLDHANEAYDVMAETAMLDADTGLHKGQVLEEAFWGLAMEYPKRTEEPGRTPDNEHYILFLDLDHFKHINDTEGHTKGDDVLKGFAGVLVHNTRQHDTPVRWGGEEFVVLLPRTGETGAWTVAERIRTAFEETGEGTVSIGCAEVDLNESLKVNIARADTALYAAKHRGRNRTVCFDELTETELAHTTTPSSD